ncbi:MAG: argininosuccinate synthase [Candidatus Oxydemutatoraceae bacterium WSBS_2016_MAG_OTU14]
MMQSINKVVLAYSGGLDTSIILRWLQEQYACEVYTFTADIGQGEEIEPARKKAEQLNAKKIFIEDLKEEFVRDFVFPMFRASAIYEDEYLLGTAIARPLIAKRLVEIAQETGASAIAHGATGKGNDQVRFELGAYSIHPDIRIIAPWREWDLNSRSDLLAYAKQHNIPIEGGGKKSPYSMDANLLHTSYEGGILEDLVEAPEESMWLRTCALEDTPNTHDIVTLDFEQGDPVKLNGQSMSPAQLLEQLNDIAGQHGVGRIDIVENRVMGMKSRGCYETPGGTVLYKAHRALEAITIDRTVQALKDELRVRYASLVYDGYWWSEERYALQALIDKTQEVVCGTIKLKIFKGNVIVLSRSSEQSLFDKDIASFEDDNGAYDQSLASGFIEMSALRLKLARRRKHKS